MVYKPASLEAAQQDAERIVKRSGTSFYWAMRLLPPEKRTAMYAVYAFCRVVDDIADDPGKPDDKRKALGDWKSEIDLIYQGKPETSVGIALVPHITTFGLRKEDFLAVIEGMEMDAGESVRIRTMEELLTYCDRVACAVGRLSNRVFGVEDPMVDTCAKVLGEALQLTNILRDIADDAAINRVYLPADRLAAAGVRYQDPMEIVNADGVGTVCEELAHMARERFVAAETALGESETRQVKPAAIMMHMYARVFAKLEQRGWKRLHTPVRLTKLEKLWIAVRFGVFS